MHINRVKEARKWERENDKNKAGYVHSYRPTLHTKSFEALLNWPKKYRRRTTWIEQEKLYRYDTQKPLEVKFSPNKFNLRTKSPNLLKHVPSVHHSKRKLPTVNVSINGTTTKTGMNSNEIPNPSAIDINIQTHTHSDSAFNGDKRRSRRFVEFLIAFCAIVSNSSSVEIFENAYLEYTPKIY